MDPNITQCDPMASSLQQPPTLALFQNAHTVAAVLLFLVAVLFHFIGQLISVTSWQTALRLGLQESAAPTDYYPYEHGSAIADVLLGWTYPVAAVGLLQNLPWAYKLSFIPASTLLYHSLSFWFWEADRRAAGHQLCSDAFRVVWVFANFATGLFTLLVAWAGPSGGVTSTPKLIHLTSFSRFLGNLLISVIVVYILILAIWQSMVLSGKKMKNPDGSTDAWSEQKNYYGIAFADLYFAFPVCMAAAISVFIAPRWGYFTFSLLSFFLIWANIMTTATSLRFEKPKITFEWFVTFPFGILLGVAYLIWMIAHFDALLGL